MNSKYNISVVVPVFNECDSLKALTERLLAVLRVFDSYEVIYVNDGSTDGSGDILDVLSEEHLGVLKNIHLRVNRGKSVALQCGFNAAQGKLVVMIDADLQDRPEEIPALIKYLKERDLDIVTGWKMIRYDSISKRLLSRLFNFVVCRFSGLNIHDFNCGLKVMRRECLKDLKLYGSLHRFILVLLANQGFRVGERKVEHSERKYGRSKYNARRIYEGLLDFLTVFFITRYLQSPLYFFGFYGMLCFVISLMCAGFFFTLHGISIFTYFPQGRLAEHPLWLLSPIMFLVGFIFIFFGLMGELIYYLFSSQQQLNQNYIRKSAGF